MIWNPAWKKLKSKKPKSFIDKIWDFHFDALEKYSGFWLPDEIKDDFFNCINKFKEVRDEQA